MTSKPDATPTENAASGSGNVAVAKRSGESDKAALARAAYDPALRAIGAGRKFIAPIMGERGLTESYAALEQQIASIKSGDLSQVERKLVAQADTLDAIFNDLARRSALNAGEYLPAMEIYMRLALKAQSQCRATLETLANIKNPPVVIARQANIAHGPQQVNNGEPGTARVRAGEKDEIDNQSHAPCRVDERRAPMLGLEQAVPMPLQSACGKGPEDVSHARGPSGGSDGQG